MRLSDVREALQSVIHKDHLAQKLYERIEETLGSDKDKISAYGYLKYLVGRYGEVANYPNCILSSSSISQFLRISETAADDFLVFVGQAAERLEGLIEMFGEDNIHCILDGLGESADPAVVYTTLIAVKDDIGSPEVYSYLQKIQPKAKDYFRRFPMVLTRLPEELREEVINYGDTGRQGVCAPAYVPVQGAGGDRLPGIQEERANIS